MPNQDPELTSHARRMRKDPTRAEAILWWLLRGRGVGVRFRRQVPIGTYVADFACLSHRVVVEIDGPTHDADERAAYDRRRDRWFQAQGWRVIRVTDDDVWSNRDDVLTEILLVIADVTSGPSLDPPHPEGP
ncbi:MAG: DUF559 domain-containing protein [Acidimicrobiia bacterium]|nr:DUF559 domain-containing protein [Acidimicrobiia bacterium]